ncbi:zf-HC2 domain-containing protein [Streptomyces sp. V3I7]|uniref:zf-HC2 domain-containing protein n=1 Tax=Streptomyces sp. V3I7 TaxID=3042278 RepID=UPI0027885164|nr:zf-HC2 domain-containing protein [Streptomyces sp. V3I7]MDQ0994299.1 hypothetical protein [Streptomyces sp. V3I7]
MRSLERHRDVGAYALGVLDEVETFRFEDHLMECPRCTARVTEFGPAARQLMLYRRATPRFVAPLALPGPRLLDRLLTEVARRHRVHRRRFLYGLAASVVLALTGPGLTLYAGQGSAPARVLAATDAHSGVRAQVRVEDRDWGSDVELKVTDATGPHTCRLIAVARDGSEQALTSWTVPGRDTRTSTMEGGSALHPDQIARYEVRTRDGRPLVTIGAR